jgi:RHS repeat-associated protein
LSNTGGTLVAVNYSNPSGDDKTWLIQFTSSFTSSDDGSLPDGGYTLTVKHSDLSGTGDPSSDKTFTFSRIYGDYTGEYDSSGESEVGFADLVILAQNFGDAPPVGMWYTPLDGDATLGFPELVKLAQNFAETEGVADSGATLMGASATPSAGVIPFGIAPQEFYYSSQWQVVQVSSLNAQTATMQTLSQNVWGLAYVNELVLRDRDADGSSSTGNLGISGSGLDERLYALQDANWNVVALVNTSGTVKERFDYDPYGNVTVLSASGTILPGDSYSWAYTFQGGRTDAVTGLINFQHRDYSPGLQRWTTEDPTGTLYIDGDDLYEFVRTNPVNKTDVSGLQGNGFSFPGDSGFPGGLQWPFIINPPPTTQPAPSPAAPKGSTLGCILDLATADAALMAANADLGSMLVTTLGPDEIQPEILAGQILALIGAIETAQKMLNAAGTDCLCGSSGGDPKLKDKAKELLDQLKDAKESYDKLRDIGGGILPKL